ncbi:MAG: phosphoglycerate mutase (2,3-diphosphoglycerate-independent), partial [Arcobacter sp.]|nr:phosphoglycerate mutase (2,3-diphosphoglycerate-independent) [Arcobacter sp.]
MSHKTLLIITDGIGHNASSNFNAFCNAKKPNYDWLFLNTPNSLIKTYGEFVGLPDGQMGNSEVGHMSIGSGRILYQDLVKVNLEIKNDTLKNNQILKETIEKSNNIHIIGLLSDGGVHSHIDHIIALAKIGAVSKKAKNVDNKDNKVFLHLITDGRDVSPTSAKIYLNQILEICDENISIATIGGRYYGMDRDNNWDRIGLAYDMLTKTTVKNKSISPLLYVDSEYEKNIFDEFITPA